MEVSEIEQIYNDLAQVPQQAATDITTQLGQAQAERGPSLAVMGSTGGNGIGAYTYNRLIQPGVQQQSDILVTTGKSEALNRGLKLALQEAQENYRNAANYYANRPRYSSYGGGSGGSSSGTLGTIAGFDEEGTTEPPKPDVDKDVRLNYGEHGGLISGSLPGSGQDFDATQINQDRLAEYLRQQRIDKWKKEHPLTPVPDWL